MSRHHLRRRKCCCGGACPCAVSDDFASDSIADYDVTGTFAVAGGVLTATTGGDCYQALQLPALGKEAGVKAKVIDNSHAMFGVFLGRGVNGPEANNRVELLWDVANTQVLAKMWVGGTLVYDEAFTGDPTSTLKITVSGVASGWTYRFFRDDVELDPGGSPFGPSFETTGWFAAGVTCDDDGGTWDDLCLISCDDLCELTFDCASAVTLPSSWILSAGSITNGASHSGGAMSHQDDCANCGGDHLIARTPIALRWGGVFPNDGCEVIETSGPFCLMHSVAFDEFAQGPGPFCSPLSSPVSGLFATYVYAPLTLPSGITTDGWGTTHMIWRVGVESFAGMWRIFAVANISFDKDGTTGVASARYRSSLVSTGYDYAVNGPVTLDFQIALDLPNWCVWPSTITLTPNGEGVKFEGAGCLPDTTEDAEEFALMQSASLVGPNDGSQCEHRGDLIEIRKCDSCGNRQKKEPVYQCSLYGECSDWDRFRSMRACRWCQDFKLRRQSPPA